MRSHAWVRPAVINTLLTIGGMLSATLVSDILRYFGLHDSDIIMVYLLGVLLVAKQTEGYLYGISASVIGVLTFNFFFTEPYYTFRAYSPDYPVTFLVMLIVAVITSTMTTTVKQEAILSQFRERRAQLLYQFSRSLLKARSMSQIKEIGVKNIAELIHRPVILAMEDGDRRLETQLIHAPGEEDSIHIFQSYPEKQVMAQTLASGRPMGAGTQEYADRLAYYLPVRGQSGILGVIGVSCLGREPLGEEHRSVLEAVATQVALAVERERLWERQQKAKMEVERERLRGNLLRAMSHDLRTPMTGILGATATILDNGDLLDDLTKRKLLQGVYEDASWLIHTIENILSITQFDEGRIVLKKMPEAVEEVVAEAVSRIKKLGTEHTLNVRIPDELILLPMDGILIEQVLVNLLDNAVKYTPHGTTIEIRALRDGDRVIFEVADDGHGLAEEDIPLLFNRFFTSKATDNSGRRGTGLGLSICQSIVDAHGGAIRAFNNPSGGATFQFELPMKEG